MDIIMFYL